MIWLFAAALLLPGCAWGPPEFHPEGLPAVVVNLVTDELERRQTKGWSKGRIPKWKEPVLEWGPLRFRSDGKTRIYRDRGAREKRRARRRDGLSSSLSLKLDTDQVYGELRFRF